MANDLNQCNFIGRLGKDPESRFLPSGKAVCKFSIASSYKFGETKSTEWSDLVAFDKLAEICGKYLEKGSKVFVTCRKSTQKWEDKSGATKYRTEFVIEKMEILSERSSDGNSGPERQAPKSKPSSKPSNGFDDMDDDIPF